MPNNFFSVDSRFPNIADKSQDEINHELINYLHLLMEQLRYTMGNLGAGNFNETALGEIAMGISEPIYRRIEDAEGNITKVQATAEGLTSRVESAEGDISVLTQTSDGLVSRVESAEGNISALTQTANGLSSRVTSAEGSISTLNQTASSLSTRVSSVEGNVSTLSQTANGLESRVSNAEGDISALEQSATSISARVGQNEIAINNLGISMMGTVTYAALENANTTTTINGANITTIGSDGVLCELSSGGIGWRYDLYQYGDIGVNYHTGLTVYGQPGLILQGGSITIRSLGSGTINIIAQSTPLFNASYGFLHGGNIMEFIINNAASIRAALGL